MIQFWYTPIFIHFFMGKDDDNPPDSQSPTDSSDSSAPPSKVPGRAAALISSAWNPQILMGFLDMGNRHAGHRLNSWYKTSIQSVLHSKFIWSGNSTRIFFWLPICWFGIWKKYGPSEYWTPTATTLCMHWFLSLVPFRGHHGTFYVHMRSAGGTLRPWSFKPRHFPGKSPLLPKEMSASTSQHIVYFCWKAAVVWPINSKPILTHTLMFFVFFDIYWYLQYSMVLRSICINPKPVRFSADLLT